MMGALESRAASSCVQNESVVHMEQMQGGNGLQRRQRCCSRSRCKRGWRICFSSVLCAEKPVADFVPLLAGVGE